MDMQLPDFSNNNYVGQVDQSFDDARKKLNDAKKNKKAKKKIKTEHFEAIDQGKSQASPATKDGMSNAEKAKSSAADPNAQAGLRGNAPGQNEAMGLLGRGLSEGMMMTSNMMGMMALSGNLGEGLAGANTRMDPSGINDVGQLMQMLSSNRAQGAQLSQGLGQVTKQATSQNKINQSTMKQFQQFTKMEKGFNMQEKMFAMKEKMMNGMGTMLDGIGKGLQAAGKALTAAATSVEAASAACNAIPFVGPAIAAALKAVAAVLKAIAKVLEAIGKQLQTVAKQLKAIAKKMGVGKQQMKGKATQMKAKGMAEKAKLSKGTESLKRLQTQREKLTQAVTQNKAQQSSIMKRIEDLKQKMGGKNFDQFMEKYDQFQQFNDLLGGGQGGQGQGGPTPTIMKPQLETYDPGATQVASSADAAGKWSQAFESSGSE